MADDEKEEHVRPPYAYYYPVPRDSSFGDSMLVWYLSVIRRRIWTVVAVLVVITTIGTVNAFRAPKIYQAAAKVLVERQSSRLIRMDALSQDGGGWDPEFYSTQVELIRSQAVMEKALEQKGVAALFHSEPQNAKRSSWVREATKTGAALLGFMPAPPPEAWERLRSEVSANIIRDTHFILIKSQGANPQRAATLVNAVAAALEQYTVERRMENLGDVFLFLEKEKKKQEQLLN